GGVTGVRPVLRPAPLLTAGVAPVAGGCAPRGPVLALRPRPRREARPPLGGSGGLGDGRAAGEATVSSSEARPWPLPEAEGPRSAPTAGTSPVRSQPARRVSPVSGPWRP